jgi:glycosyltransferase involved in cell wall biosynthesis
MKALTLVEILFWLSAGGVLYTYVGYPVALWWLARRRVSTHTNAGDPAPGVTLIVPFHNEEAKVVSKIENTAALRYPGDRLQVVLVSDGSTDDTVRRLRAAATPGMMVIELPVRRGKAAALNAGLAAANHDVVVFSDASIALEPEALQHLVAPFADASIGVVSGEDRIAESGGEGWYGRYELLLRRLESSVHSIVGASGSFYAQRRALCGRFAEGMAPDFLSVLRTVELGSRAISEPTAVGAMTSVKDPSREFERKVRTSIRGMTTLFGHSRLLNPIRFGMFSVQLWSHKVLRWAVPFLLLLLLGSSVLLAESPFFAAILGLQVFFYGLALGAHARLMDLHRTLPGKIALYFSIVNVALFVAWIRYAAGTRQELWTPSRRS